MQKPSWQAIFRSFYSADFYREVVANWRGSGYLYLFLLLSLVVILQAVKIQHVHAPYAQKRTDALIDQLPDITINNGKLSIDKPCPYVMQDTVSDDKHGFEIVFDTRPKPIDIKDKDRMILVTSNTIYAKKSKWEIREYDLSSVDKFNLNKAIVKDPSHTFFSWLGAIFLVFWLPILFIATIIQTLICALIGKLFASMNKVNLTYGTLVRLVTTAFTPVIWLDLVTSLADINFRFKGLICLVIILGYIYFAVDANKTLNKQNA